MNSETQFSQEKSMFVMSMMTPDSHSHYHCRPAERSAGRSKMAGVSERSLTEMNREVIERFNPMTDRNHEVQVLRNRSLDRNDAGRSRDHVIVAVFVATNGIPSRA